MSSCPAMAVKSLPSSILLTVLAILSATLLLLPVDGAVHSNIMSVRIRNELPGVLAVHCKSGDDDLGQRYLPSWGTPYYFHFKNNFWGSTLFWCRFSYGPVLWNAFEVWRGSGLFGRKKMPCVQCLWVARTDAFYRAQEGRNAQLAPVYPCRSDPQAMISDSEAEDVSDLRD